MSRRNVAWLVAIVVVGVGVGFATGWLLGLLAAVVVLVVSEVIERSRRERLRRDRGETGPRPGIRDAVGQRRRRR